MNINVNRNPNLQCKVKTSKVWIQILCWCMCNLFSITVATTWTLWNSWSSCNQICNTGSRYRDRQCPGSVPLGDINRPPKTAQYGGQRDCANNPRHTENCNTFYCNRKLKWQIIQLKNVASSNFNSISMCYNWYFINIQVLL